MKTTVILITGHPATGKTTLAHYLAEELELPLVCKDQIKESLVDTLGAASTEASRQLSSAAWTLLYMQVENLLKASVSHLVESNFDPIFANGRWQTFKQMYNFRLIQVRCTTEPEALLQRYRLRIQTGKRHTGHVDASREPEFLVSIQQPMDWVQVEGDRLSLDTTKINKANYAKIAEELKILCSNY